jgi:pyridoxal 5'-phosphate synthase pdxT subunit
MQRDRTIGVLAVQGAFEAHARAVRDLGHRAVLVRAPSDFDALFALPAEAAGIILPGGESTVQLDLMRRLELEAPLLALVARGVPVLATCAGLILAARRVENPSQRSYGFIDVTVSRNAWGRQVDSFEGTSDRGRDVVFIRAPRIVDVGVGRSVEVLDTVKGEPVLVREGNITGATFHPELTTDREVHRCALGVERSLDRLSGADRAEMHALRHGI